jgi:hypothetical protein
VSCLPISGGNAVWLALIFLSGVAAGISALVIWQNWGKPYASDSTPPEDGPQA